jgi:hypothetical protein
MKVQYRAAIERQGLLTIIFLPLTFHLRPQKLPEKGKTMQIEAKYPVAWKLSRK